MVRSLPALMALSLVAAQAAAEVSIQQRGARLDLSATRAPVSEVLDRLARQTGMKVVYDGAPPRQIVTVTVRDHTPAEAVAEVLEGLGLNYALIADPTGTNVQTLMLTARTATGATAAVASTPGGRTPEPNSHRPYVPPAGVAGDEPAEDVQDDTAANPGMPPEANNPPQGPMGQPPGNTVPQQQPYATPVAPPQQFPVSPFAPQPTAPAPGVAPPLGNRPMQSPATQQPPAQQP